MTIEEKEQRIFELDHRLMRRDHIGDHNGEEEERRERNRLQAEIDQAQRTAAREARRAPIALVLIGPSGTQIRSPFIAIEANRLVDFCTDRVITVIWDALHQRGNRHTRTVHVESALTEEAVIRAWHEIAHVICPEAQGEQQPHRYVDTQLFSPLAEIEAWRFAARQVGHFTSRMHDETQSCLGTYQRHTATSAEEREAITAFYGESFGRIVPSPDSMEGRLARARTISREMHATHITSHSRLDRAERILREAGL